jgi:HPt (histidine-containing phosphotransfer) domain-containing protein
VTDRVLDPDAIDRLLDITGGDPGFVDELIDTYLEDAEAQLAALRQAARDGDTVSLERPAHSLKSSSATVGAMALAELCRSLEADARTGVVDDATGRVTACDRAFASARVELVAARMRDSLPAGPARGRSAADDLA